MKRLAALLLASAILSGCGASPEPVKTASAATNAGACTAFETTTIDLADRMVKGSDDSNADEFMETMNGMRGRFDEAALSGQSEVKERIETLVDNLPAKVHMLFIDHDAYFEDVASVNRACKADGFPVSPSIWK